MTSSLVAEAASDALYGHDGKVLVARVVRTIHDAHTDAHLEIGLVLSESSSWILVTSLDRNLLVLAYIGYALFTRCGPALFTCWRFLFVLLWTPLCSRLSGPVSAPRRRRLRSPNSHYLCNVRPWKRQGLGCLDKLFTRPPRADPRVHRTFCHVLCLRTLSHVLRVVWESPAPL